MKLGDFLRRSDMMKKLWKATMILLHGFRQKKPEDMKRYFDEALKMVDELSDLEKAIFGVIIELSVFIYLTKEVKELTGGSKG